MSKRNEKNNIVKLVEKNVACWVIHHQDCTSPADGNRGASEGEQERPSPVLTASAVTVFITHRSLKLYETIFLVFLSMHWHYKYILLLKSILRVLLQFPFFRSPSETCTGIVQLLDKYSYDDWRTVDVFYCH